jgi:acid phosphatase (class A)
MKIAIIVGVGLMGWWAAGRAEDNVMRATPAATNAATATHFVDLANFDFAALVPPPPAAGSIAADADLAAVRQAQAWRTPDQMAWAKVVERDDAFNHASVLGAWFAREKLPLTAAFFQALGDDLRAVDAAAKKPFLRPRPMAVDPTLKPCVALPASTSYPSGSALQAFVWAELLADALPENRVALFERAERAGWGRVIGGVHFPSDLVAGRRLVTPFLEQCRKSAAFREAWSRAEAELRAAARAATVPR